MCTAYWTLTDVEFSCPSCGATSRDDLQTHFMGDFGSFLHRYALAQPVDELVAVSAVVGRDGQPDLWIGECAACNAAIDFGGRIEAGAVTAVWPERYRDRVIEEHAVDGLVIRRVVEQGPSIEV